jgi:hypothetical protein
LTRHKLSKEAAEQYNSSLSYAPEIRYLKEDAIQAIRLAGRPSCLKQLQTRLATQRQFVNQY